MKEEISHPDPDETADDETCDDAASCGDRDVTRLASEAELADLARLRAKEPRRRNFLFSVVISLLLGTVAAMIAVLLARNEKSITWPGEVSDAYDDTRRLLYVGEGTALLVYWPNAPENVVTGDGTNLIDAVTAVGRDRTVPFHLRVTQAILTNGLRRTTRDSYADWKRARVHDGWFFSSSGERLIFLNTSENGYPAWSVDYTRTNAGSTLAGRALYIRHIDREIVVLRELPNSLRGRADKVLDGYPCVAANLSAVRARFEIPAEREAGRLRDLALDAYDDLQDGFLAADWRRLDRVLRTMILSARENGDRRLLQNATLLYSTFRMKLQNWYIRECLEFQQLKGRLNARSIDEDAFFANCTAIRRECARRLPDEDDYRQRRVANDDWSVQP